MNANANARSTLPTLEPFYYLETEKGESTSASWMRWRRWTQTEVDTEQGPMCGAYADAAKLKNLTDCLHHAMRRAWAAPATGGFHHRN
jgi:hypothetical protein